MNIHLIVVAFGLADDLLALYSAAHAANVTWHIYLHSRIPAVVEACAMLHQQANVHLYDYGFNRGLAASWNDGLYTAYSQGADVALIANDDAEPGSGDVDRIATAAMNRRACYLVDGYGIDVRTQRDGPMRFSLAAINPIALETLGCFDENFFPIYYEDVDWYYRAKLAGLEWYTVPDTFIVHQGSKSLALVPPDRHHARFIGNRNYYAQKWGGDKGEERFGMPFDDARFNRSAAFYIPFARRHNPYGIYDRVNPAVGKAANNG